MAGPMSTEDLGEHVQTDRRTRDRIRLFFWALLTVVCLVAALVARQQQQQGLCSARPTPPRNVRSGTRRTCSWTRSTPIGSARPIERSGYDELLTDVKTDCSPIGACPAGADLRDADGLLVFTTDDASQIGKVTSPR